jgi:hypothetical protein
VVQEKLKDNIHMQIHDPEKKSPIEVPIEAISSEALSGVIDAFVLREGTDYGRNELPHAEKVQEIRRQLVQGRIVLVFDSETESLTFVSIEDWKRTR